MGYANISMSNLRGLFFNNTSIRSGSLQENKVKNINFKEADLTGTQFFKTSLKNIDLSNSQIEGIAISLEDIKGAIIDQIQAIDLLYLIGVKIKQ